MNTFSTSEFNQLLEHPRQLVLSLYMPTTRGGPQSQQNRTRLNNLLRMSETQLLALDVAEQQRKTLLAPIRELVDLPVRMQTGDGLAIFAASDVVRTYHLPIAVPELVTLDMCFHVTPLLPLLSMQHPWAILALSKDRIRLLCGTRAALHELPLPDVPHSLAEALHYDEFEKQHQLHSGVGVHGSRGERSAIFHGQGDHSDVEKEELRRFFRMVDHGLVRALANQRMPLVLAGVAYETAIYREQTMYPQVVNGSVTGNPDDLDADELAERGWSLVEPNWTQEQHAALDRYSTLAGSGLTATQLDEIIPAAVGGRIDTVLIGLGQQVWGRFNADDQRARISAEREPGDTELLNMIVVETLAHHGRVFAVPLDHMPVAAAVAAMFRY